MIKGIQSKSVIASMARMLAALIILLAVSLPAVAHDSKQGKGSVAGIPITEITHGQMPVIFRYTRDILALAESQPSPTSDFQRVLNYAKSQRVYCLWGLVPGSISDEASPFNACSHAYLAALRELLLRMDKDPTNVAADDLVRRVDFDLLMFSSALELCNYSAVPYDTATLVRPVWSDILRHPASLASLLALLLSVMGLAIWFLRWVSSSQRPAIYPHI